MWVNKLLWAEGVILGQQQFQQWDAYVHQTLVMHMHTAFPYHWGLLTYAIDEQPLTLGEFNLCHCQAIFPDGTLIHYQAQRQTPLGLSLSSMKDDQTTIYLGLPRNETATGIAGYTDHPVAQWQAQYQMVPDRFDADKQREVLFGMPALRLLTREEDLSPFLTLPLAHIRGMSHQQYQLVETFVPACCHLQASARLMSLIQHWRQALQQKLTALLQADDTAMEQLLVIYATRHTLFQLQQLHQNPKWHPWRLYQVMGQWLNGVADATQSTPLTQLPEFTQDRLTDVFASLHQLVRQRLAHIHPPRQLEWVLQPATAGWWNSGLMESTLLQARQCWLLVTGMDSSMQEVNQWMELAKVAATTAMPQLLAAAMPGIPLQFHGNKINATGMASSTVWFALDVTHALWQQVIAQQQLTVYLPSTDATLELKLLFK